MRLPILFLTILALVAVVVIPLYFVLAQVPTPERTLPDTVHRGETFNVTVSFVNIASPEENFSSPVITDRAPEGWTVEVRKAWCSPTPGDVKATNDAILKVNKVEILWEGHAYPEGTNFTAKYKVTVPDDAVPGNFSGTLHYHNETTGYHGEDETIESDCYIYVSSHISSPGGGGGGTVVRGDANEDGEVNQDDVVRVRGIILGIADVTAGADCNGDGEVDALDITAVKRIIAELD